MATGGKRGPKKASSRADRGRVGSTLGRIEQYNATIRQCHSVLEEAVGSWDVDQSTVDTVSTCTRTVTEHTQLLETVMPEITQVNQLIHSINGCSATVRADATKPVVFRRPRAGASEMCNPDEIIFFLSALHTVYTSGLNLLYTDYKACFDAAAECDEFLRCYAYTKEKTKDVNDTALQISEFASINRNQSNVLPSLISPSTEIKVMFYQV